MTGRFHIMVLSGGSLIGQNILDSLEGRRERVRLTGVNQHAGHPRLYRYDRVHLCPPLESDTFRPFLLELIERERPDAILPGRDHDTVELAELAAASPELRPRIPCGDPEAARTMNDKGLSCRFAVRRGLPFAPTCLVEDEGREAVRAWAAAQGFPLLAKPRRGYGSLGVRILTRSRQLEAFLDRHGEGYILQKYLDLRPERERFIEEYLRDLDCGVPLFFDLPEEGQYAGQAVIAPDGRVGRVFTSVNRMVIGRCERSAPHLDPALEALTRAYAEAMASSGWRGMFNLQCRRTPDGYAAHEMNGRMSGSTSARRWLGYDEVRELVSGFFGVDIGPDRREEGVEPGEGVVCRSLSDDFVARRELDRLARDRIWDRDTNPGHPPNGAPDRDANPGHPRNRSQGSGPVGGGGKRRG
jgi:carbamoyl-phosphate synthase large subunit